MRKRKFFPGLIVLAAALFLCLCLTPDTAHAQRKEADIKKLLPGYDDWFTWYSDPLNKDFTVMVCPKKDVSNDEIMYYIEDIAESLDGKLETDITKVRVDFPFTTDRYGQNKEKYEKDMFALKNRLNYRWTYWSGLDMLDIHAATESAGEIIGYTAYVYLDLNGGLPDYSEKITSLVQECKNAVGNDQRRQVNWFCDWLFKNVDYDATLMTNSAYVAVMEGEAVCGGYANALRDLCDEAGIPALVLTSDPLNHAWNQVYVDGKWYTADLVGLVYSSSNQNDREQGEYLFDDPNAQCDDPAFLEKLKSEIFAPTPILSKCKTLTVTEPCSIRKYVRNTAPGAKITYQSSKPSVVAVNSQGEVSPGAEGSTKIKIKVVQNNKTYQLSLKVKSKIKLHKKGSKLTYKNGTYKVVKPAAKKESKITAGTVEWTGVKSKTLKSFTVPEKIKIGKVSYKVVSVGKNALKNHKKIEKLTIPSGVSKIGSQAFSGCSRLKTITIRTSKLTSKNVGSKAFQGINSKAKIKVPKRKLKAYKTLLKKKGIGKRVKVTK